MDCVYSVWINECIWEHIMSDVTSYRVCGSENDYTYVFYAFRMTNLPSLSPCLQVLFALNQTLLQHESLRAGILQGGFTTEDLITHYNCGDLNSIIFNHDTSQVCAQKTQPVPVLCIMWVCIGVIMSLKFEQQQVPSDGWPIILHFTLQHAKRLKQQHTHIARERTNISGKMWGSSKTRKGGNIYLLFHISCKGQTQGS